ncbi:General alpha-glucoside permease [Tolypocladium ophioglossoides CBS 100239]|uniref:General alpha-glucoside permease n=1 Tax=Tolypocladium ophioglossoides (strain CBS 100239) TaxID=1163406 RepID=A0A0L0MWT2_TOLOC|nr:General alpha-glucoside permease [Tolypocladium ophioglossoides CBS 100239]
MDTRTLSFPEKTLQVTHDERLTAVEDAAAQEHDLSFFQALKLYPKGVFWSVVMSTALIMEGYDTKLISTLFAQPAFQRAYGLAQKNNSYQISAPWQAGLTNGSAIGQLLGLLISGSVCERYGFRITMIVGMAVTMAMIFIPFFASNLVVLEVGRSFLAQAGSLIQSSGIPLGLFQTIPVVYALEISPISLRAHLTTYVNLCWYRLNMPKIFGQITATGILRGVLNMDNSWAYRIPFAIHAHSTFRWFWPVILIPAIYFAPESPWWLVRRGRLGEARDVVTRLTSPQNANFDVDKNITLMEVTTEHERQLNAETSYRACFAGTDLRRTIIVIGCYCIQTLSGNPLRAYSTYFFQQAGLPTEQAFNMSIVGFALGIVGMILAWLLIPHCGRRTIYLAGLVLLFIVLVVIGGLGVPQANSPTPGLAWGIGALLLASSLVYNCTIGPVTYALIAELPSALLRSKSVVLARWTYSVLNIIANVITPYQLNPSAWGWSARTAFFWAGACLIATVFTYFYIPEPKGRTTAELDILFERKVSARKFDRTAVNLSEVVGDNGEKVGRCVSGQNEKQTDWGSLDLAIYAQLWGKASYQ